MKSVNKGILLNRNLSKNIQKITFKGNYKENVFYYSIQQVSESKQEWKTFQ